MLRYRSPTQFLARKAARDVELGGQQIKAGQWIVFYLGSANHDPKVFDEPERFDITRSPNRHLAFSHGVHFCLGAPLARLEGKVALRLLLERLQDLRLAEGETIEALDNPLIYRLSHLRVSFMSGAKHYS